MERKLSLKEMAERLGCSAKTFGKYVKVYKIPHLVLGRSKRFDPETVEAVLSVKPQVAKKPVRHISSRPIKPISKYAEALGL